MGNIANDLLLVGILLGVILLVYTKSKKQTFRQTIEDIKGVFGGSQDG